MDQTYESNVKRTDWKSIILFIASVFITSFFLTASLGIIKYDLLRNYYNLELVELSDLRFFIPIFLGFFVLLFFIIKKFLYKQHELILSFSWLALLFLFSYFSPVKSLVIGAMIFAVPALYLSISKTLLIKVDKLNLGQKIATIVIAVINLLIFLSLIYLLVIKSKIDYFPPDSVNGSMISNDVIYYDHMKERWNKVFLLFGAFSFLYVVGLILSIFTSFRYKKILIKTGWIITGLLLIAQVVVFTVSMVYRLKVFTTSTYDFGIFIQMFYNMKAGNGMLTTLERSIILSHNHVHFSPIYYLMLPVFLIFPFAETLQAMQILIVGIGLLPLWLITKELKTNKLLQILIMIMYIFSPALITSSFYDLHENAFLAPLLLFVLYFGLKKQTLPLIIFTGLTLIVKEDASLYLFFIGLFFLFSSIFSKTGNKKIKSIFNASFVIVSSLVYFILITNYLNQSGDGAMFWRYSNINFDEDLGLKGILLGFILNPSFFLATFFSPLKINTLLLLLGSVGFIPLFIKNKAAFFLAAPVIIMNFLSTYPYQHQFGFQYFYGSATLLIFMVLLAEHDNSSFSIFRGKFKNISIINLLAIIGISVSLVHGIAYIDEKTWTYENYQANQEMYDDMKETLQSIPKDKKVVATGYLTPYLADRYYLYDYDYYNLRAHGEGIDYVIVDLRIGEDILNNIIRNVENSGFTESPLSTEYILIFVPS